MITAGIIIFITVKLIKLAVSKLPDRTRLDLGESVLPEQTVSKQGKQTDRSILMAQKQAEKQRKAQAERQQAEADEAFLIDQIDKLYQMLWDADADLELARKICQHDNDMNRTGAVVSIKDVTKHRTERDKLAKKVMNLERSIHSFETKLNKARFVLAD